MKIKISKIYLVIAGSFLSAVSCSKNSNSSSEKTKADFIASSTWKYSEAGFDIDGNGTIDQAAPSALVMPCLTDNTITFKADKTGNIDEGATKCDASTAQVAPFTWNLAANDTLTLSTPILTGFGNSARVREITATRFVLSNSIIYSGASLPVVVVLVH